MQPIFILCCFILATVQTLWADGGTIQFQGDTGPFHVTLFTQPPILRAGLIDFTMLLQDRSSLSPILDADVAFHFTREKNDAPAKAQWVPPACVLTRTQDLSDIPATLGGGENRLLYGSVVRLPNSGRWQLKARIRRGGETAEIQAPLLIQPALAPPLAYWHLFLLIPGAIAGFVIYQSAKAQRFKTVQGGTTSLAVPRKLRI